MSKYGSLWEYVKNNGGGRLTLTFAEIKEITGAGVDHSFLSYKKELTAFGYNVGKISLKNKTVEFIRAGE